MTQYEILGRKITELAGNKHEITMTMREIDNLPFLDLPPSAKELQTWWANTDQKTHAYHGWLKHGWRVKKVDIKKEVVTFERLSSDQLEKPMKESVNDAKVDFQNQVRDAAEEKFNKQLFEGELDESIPFKFHLISEDKRYVGHINFIPEARQSAAKNTQNLQITRDIFYLEKTNAEKPFYVVGGNRDIFYKWLENNKKIISRDIDFYTLEVLGEEQYSLKYILPK